MLAVAAAPTITTTYRHSVVASSTSKVNVPDASRSLSASDGAPIPLSPMASIKGYTHTDIHVFSLSNSTTCFQAF